MVIYCSELGGRLQPPHEAGAESLGVRIYEDTKVIGLENDGVGVLATTPLGRMSSGVMPVVSRVSGADDLVEEGVSGFLFTPGDEMALARRLERSLAITSECRRAMGEEARKAVRDRFCIDRVAEHHLSLYRSLIESAR